MSLTTASSTPREGPGDGHERNVQAGRQPTNRWGCMLSDGEARLV